MGEKTGGEGAGGERDPGEGWSSVAQYALLTYGNMPV